MNPVDTVSASVHIAISPINNFVYMVYSDGTGYQILNPSSGSLSAFQPIIGISANTPQAVFTMDGRLLVGAVSGTIYQVDLNTGVATALYPANIQGGDMAIGPNGNLYNFSRAASGQIILVDTTGGGNTVLGTGIGGVTGSALSVDGTFILSQSNSTSFVEYDINGNPTGRSYQTNLNGQSYTLNSGDMAGRPFINLFNWDGDSTNADLDSIPWGYYKITVRDDRGCTTEFDSIFVGQNPELLLTSTSTPVFCPNDTTGTATVNPTGGSAPYQYLWSNGDTTQTAVNLIAGDHFVTVTDTNGLFRD